MCVCVRAWSQRPTLQAGLNASGTLVPPAPLLPAPTAMLPSDLLNLHAYMVRGTRATHRMLDSPERGA